MIVKAERFWLISKNSNDDYWGKTKSPDWTKVGSIKHYPKEGMGAGVEPHYHDADEVWIFAYGRGEVWIDGKSFDVTGNTAVYTPMGAIHRYQMFQDYDTVSVVTKLERQKRDTHLYPEEHGEPVPTVPGFVLPGATNTGPVSERGERCPFTELRLVDVRAGDEIEEAIIDANEHWVVIHGVARIDVDGARADMVVGDVAMLRSGARRRIGSLGGARLGLART
jgi:mannose-6-phosphate isomerase-like protein (cupin superfamily)